MSQRSNPHINPQDNLVVGVPCVSIARWYKNGDHPKDYAEDRWGMVADEMTKIPASEAKTKQWEGSVVRYYRLPGSVGRRCPYCGILFDLHGWIDSGGAGQNVCPGDYIVESFEGVYTVIRAHVLAAIRLVTINEAKEAICEKLRQFKISSRMHTFDYRDIRDAIIDLYPVRAGGT